MPQSQSKTPIIIAMIVFIVGAVLGLNYIRLAWTLDANGLSVMTERLPFWDFTNLWGGGRMALEGHVDYLFAVDRYRAALRELLTPLLLDQEWSYPPSMLLIGAPLALIPILPAYLIWTGGTLGLLFVTAGCLGLPRWMRFAILFSPPTLISVLLGQNGALTASLLVGGLALAPTRPLLAGIFFGVLTLKPHLGILVPFCLLASGNYRAILSAAVTTVTIFVVTGVLFGWASWTLFLDVTNPMMRAIMEALYPQGYQMNAMTFFTLARSVGADVMQAYAAQIAAALLAIALASWIWWKERIADHPTKVAITGLLALCATPYGYTYDAIPLALAIAVLWQAGLIPISLLAVGWLYPMINHVVAMHYYSLGALVPITVAVAAIVNLRSRTRAPVDNPASKPIKAS